MWPIRTVCHREVATDEARMARLNHASNAPMPGEHRICERPGQTEKDSTKPLWIEVAH
jgi:hypothetical protein